MKGFTKSGRLTGYGQLRTLARASGMHVSATCIVPVSLCPRHLRILLSTIQGKYIAISNMLYRPR